MKNAIFFTFFYTTKILFINLSLHLTTLWHCIYIDNELSQSLSRHKSSSRLAVFQCDCQVIMFLPHIVYWNIVFFFNFIFSVKTVILVRKEDIVNEIAGTGKLSLADIWIEIWRKFKNKIIVLRSMKRTKRQKAIIGL